MSIACEVCGKPSEVTRYLPYVQEVELCDECDNRLAKEFQFFWPRFTCKFSFGEQCFLWVGSIIIAFAMAKLFMLIAKAI